MGETTSITAGWYPDPRAEATLRYWDGSSWSSLTRSAPLPGWYPDPKDASLIRYWQGVKWTPQTKQRQEIKTPSEKLTNARPPRVTEAKVKEEEFKQKFSVA